MERVNWNRKRRKERSYKKEWLEWNAWLCCCTELSMVLKPLCPTGLGNNSLPVFCVKPANSTGFAGLTHSTDVEPRPSSGLSSISPLKINLQRVQNDSPMSKTDCIKTAKFKELWFAFNLSIFVCYLSSPPSFTFLLLLHKMPVMLMLFSSHSNTLQKFHNVWSSENRMIICRNRSGYSYDVKHTHILPINPLIIRR